MSARRLLLHTCCGPCSIYPIERLSTAYEVAGYYYNPNIHPEEEYARRLSTAKQYASGLGIRFITGPYDPEQYFRAVAVDEAKPNRCAHCYSLRLSAAASAAQELQFDAFTSTLLVSPYQDRERILEAGREAAGVAGVDFVEEDFRDGYRAVQVRSRELGMYRQKYCGCRFSETEAAQERRQAQKKEARKTI